MYPNGPMAMRGQRIGLLGGSFDPPHLGHVHITLWALRALKLDRIWWLVSPGNPLKCRPPAPIEERVAVAQRLMRHPRVDITDIEQRLGSVYTADTLRRLSLAYPGVRFIWLMGADNLASFHRWEKWEWIACNYSIAAFARPGEQLRAGLSPMARRFAQQRVQPSVARLLGTGDSARWTLLTGLMSADSSTEIRDRGLWP